jgi:hypothetical protein
MVGKWQSRQFERFCLAVLFDAIETNSLFYAVNRMSKHFAAMCRNPHFIAAASDHTVCALSLVDKLRKATQLRAPPLDVAIIACSDLLAKYVVVYRFADLEEVIASVRDPTLRYASM